MSITAELGASVRRRRTDMGLTQAAVAELSGLSRATVNQLEKGASKTDLSLNRAARLTEVLGLSLTVGLPERVKAGKSRAVDLAAQLASISYRTPLKARQLRNILQNGEISPEFLPHLNTVLDEAPVSLLAQVVEQLHDEDGMERAQVWQQMRSLARRMKSSRGLWQ
jgi:transcriptional regulator with XRE-family HTH domain